MQELKDAMQHEKVLQEAAVSAQSQAQDASQHQQELAQENAALRHEIQVSIKTTSCNPHRVEGCSGNCS